VATTRTLDLAIRLLFIVSILALPVNAAGDGPDHWLRVANKFTVQPTPVDVSGQAGAHPVAGVFLLDPKPGECRNDYPIEKGATEAFIPAHPIYINPFVPTSNSGFTANGVLPTDAPWFQVQLPAMQLDLPYPVPETAHVMTVPLAQPLELSVPIRPFTLPIIYLPYGPGVVSSTGMGHMEMPLAPVTVLILDLRGHEPVIHNGRLEYALSTKTKPNSKNPWSWRVAGRWDVTIADWSSKPDHADLTHHRYYNSTGGCLLSASEPAIPEMAQLPVTSGGPKSRPEFKVQFHKMSGGGSHNLVFANTRPQGPSKMEQPFPSVAMIALGQWMRKMGSPDLKVKAPRVPADKPITWTVEVDDERELTLRWWMASEE